MAISAQLELFETALSTGNAQNAWDTGITLFLTMKKDQHARTAEMTSDIAHGVLGTLTGDLTNVLSVKKELSMILSQETVSQNAEDLSHSHYTLNQVHSLLSKIHVLTSVL